MQTFLYIIWFLLPTFFFLAALWSKLEQVGGRVKRDNPGDLIRQGFFVLACVVVAVVLDKTILPSIADSIDPVTIPLDFYRALLLPAVLVIGAKAVGGSKAILISKDAPKKPIRRNRGRRR